MPSTQTHHKLPACPGRRERRRAEIRERLFCAALQLFAKHGFLETTVEDITEAADVGKGTFFNYFPTKEHVLATFGAERLAVIECGVERARTTSGPVLPIIREIATGLAGQSSKNPALLRAIYAAHASCPAVRDELRKRLHKGRQHLTELFTMAQQRGEIRRDISVAECARLTQTIFLGAMMAWAVHPEGSLRAAADGIWEFIVPNLLPGNKTIPQGPDYSCPIKSQKSTKS